jgi:hypothetical protein
MIPSWATGGVLSAPPTPLITTGYVAGNSLAAQNFNWILNHITLEINNVLTDGGQAQNSAVDTQLRSAIRAMILSKVWPSLYIALSVGSPYSLVNGSYGTVDVTTGATGYQVVLPSAQSALAIGFEVDLRKADSGSGSVLVTVTAGDYLAGYLNGQWQVTEQYGHVKVRPVQVGGAYGWIVESCDGTVFRSSINTTQTQASPAQNSWYNRGGSITVPPGVYEVEYSCCVSDLGSYTTYTTLSTANNSESDPDLSAALPYSAAPTPCPVSRKKRVVVSVSTTFYLNIGTMSASANTLQLIAGGMGGNIRIEAKRVG